LDRRIFQVSVKLRPGGLPGERKRRKTSLQKGFKAKKEKKDRKRKRKRVIKRHKGVHIGVKRVLDL